MKILVLYRPESEHARAVETFIRDFQNTHEALADRVEVVDIDTRDGMATASIYDIMRHPAILILRDDGSVVKDWTEAEGLPLLDEVANYAYGAS